MFIVFSLFSWGVHDFTVDQKAAMTPTFEHLFRCIPPSPKTGLNEIVVAWWGREYANKDNNYIPSLKLTNIAPENTRKLLVFQPSISGALAVRFRRGDK